jgi:hypothetical protein
MKLRSIVLDAFLWTPVAAVADLRLAAGGVARRRVDDVDRRSDVR